MEVSIVPREPTKKRRSIDQTFVNWWKLSASASAIVCVDGDDVARKKKNRIRFPIRL